MLMIMTIKLPPIIKRQHTIDGNRGKDGHSQYFPTAMRKKTLYLVQNLLFDSPNSTCYPSIHKLIFYSSPSWPGFPTLCQWQAVRSKDGFCVIIDH